MEAVANLLDDGTPLAGDGPSHPVRTALVASWWLLREVEAGNLRRQDVTFQNGEARLTLPASKNDQTGIGTSRSLRCICETDRAALCPYHLAMAQHNWSGKVAETAGFAANEAPHFPAAAGQPCTKRGMSATVLALANKLGLVVVDTTGAPRFSGHVFRVSGAIHLARCGIDVWRIQLHGRWGSEAVLRYVRLAPLAGNLALEATLRRDLSHVREQLEEAKGRLALAAMESERNPREVSLRDILDRGLRVQDAKGPLCTPDAEVICCGTAGRNIRAKRRPKASEVIVSYPDGKRHALRTPRCQIDGDDLAELRDRLESDSDDLTWCGLRFGPNADVFMEIWDEKETRLCRRCFAFADTSGATSSSSSSSTSSAT